MGFFFKSSRKSLKKMGYLCVLSFMSFCVHNEPEGMIKMSCSNYFFSHCFENASYLFVPI